MGNEGCEHIEYTAGDDLGFVRMSPRGGIEFRELRHGALEPRHKLTKKLQREDDVVAVDASEHSLLVSFTRDIPADCKSGTRGKDESRAQLHALVVPRRGGAETESVLTTAACDTEIGPFFSGFVGSLWVLGWPERALKKSAIDPPVTGLAFVTLDAGRVSDVQRILVPAEAIVDAGCDRKACYAVALTRPIATDGMAPGTARVLTYP